MNLLSLRFIGTALLTLIFIGGVYQYLSTKLDEYNYPPIGKMVDIGGYKVHMIDLGVHKEVSKPTIIMDAANGSNCLDWQLVQPEIAKFARVVTYDRAGYAWSDASPLQRTSVNIAQELHDMLHAAKIPGPYILVGHSFGGLNVRLYANKYPDEVVGIILVDTSHEDEGKILPAPAPAYLQKIMIGAVYVGVLRLLNHLPFMRKNLEKQIEKYSPEIQNMYQSQKTATKFWAAVYAEGSLKSQDCQELKRQAPSLGDLPLTVISAGKPMLDYEQVKKFYSYDQVQKVNEGWQQLQADLVKKSSQSKHLVAEHSGHIIPYDQPEIIVHAVHDMVEGLCKEK